MDRHPTGDCTHCPGVKEHMVHWQCACPQFQDSRQAAHNLISVELYSSLRAHAGPKWKILLETPMSNTPLRTSPPYKNWQPDALAFNSTDKRLILLELTLCNDSRHHLNTDATSRKELKYDDLLQDLNLLNNNWKASLHTTAIGYLTSVNVPTLEALYRELDIPPFSHFSITDNLIKTTARAFSKMARERLQAQHSPAAIAPHPRPPTRHTQAK
jgi:hypothetical protein